MTPDRCFARKAPPLPFLPEEIHGTEVLVLAAMYVGDMADGEKALAPLRAVGNPIADVVGPHPFVGWQQAFDPLLTPGERNYWKTHDFAALSDDLIDTVLDYVGRLPDPQSEVFFGQLGGAQGRVPDEATAYQGRKSAFVMNVHGRWSDPARDDACIAWCRDLFEATAPFATGEAYVNFMTGEEADRLEDAYGDSYQKSRMHLPTKHETSHPPPRDSRLPSGGRTKVEGVSLGSRRLLTPLSHACDATEVDNAV